ncbi:hypothetical protein SmJEL517_g05441 [Synchytrium microbalum]|uniref:Ca3427-like PBP 2 domain-containing protein n=1 Tax=Synchytrium microbalum TaxID=1806994 RepID=A0A507BVE8_9FUNG|nr:uncharacterized protein SmJEL517_g05441 [Synchytrium microbalum]TPX31208.1 hypothetical protein SmJEL517_g05441 [Synchytrium microbalum]
MTVSETAITVGLVPEHFSSPMYQLEQKLKTEDGIKIELVNCPGGSGEMISLINSGKVDVVIALTEALLAQSLKGGPADYRLVGTYVKSPLTWAIATNPSSPTFSAFTREEGPWDPLKGSRIGVSRLGSGSHIIPFVMKRMKGWQEDFTFVPLKDIHGLVQGVTEDSCDAFLWEKTMTKGYFDSGKLHHLSNVTPPWPAFSIAASNHMIESRSSELVDLLDGITAATSQFMSDESAAVEYISKRFHQEVVDVEKWIKTVEYPVDARHVDPAVIKSCSATLKESGLIAKEAEWEQVCDATIAKKSET